MTIKTGHILASYDQPPQQRGGYRAGAPEDDEESYLNEPEERQHLAQTPSAAATAARAIAIAFAQQAQAHPHSYGQLAQQQYVQRPRAPQGHPAGPPQAAYGVQPRQAPGAGAGRHDVGCAGVLADWPVLSCLLRGCMAAPAAALPGLFLAHYIAMILLCIVIPYVALFA